MSFQCFGSDRGKCAIANAKALFDTLQKFRGHHHSWATAPQIWYNFDSPCSLDPTISISKWMLSFYLWKYYLWIVNCCSVSKKKIHTVIPGHSFIVAVLLSWWSQALRKNSYPLWDTDTWQELTGFLSWPLMPFGRIMKGFLAPQLPSIRYIASYCPHSVMYIF